MDHGSLGQTRYGDDVNNGVPLPMIVPGLAEGIRLMKTGESYRFWIPANLAYGDAPKVSGAAAGALVLDVTLDR